MTRVELSNAPPRSSAHPVLVLPEHVLLEQHLLQPGRAHEPAGGLLLPSGGTPRRSVCSRPHMWMQLVPFFFGVVVDCSMLMKLNICVFFLTMSPTFNYLYACHKFTAFHNCFDLVKKKNTLN